MQLMIEGEELHMHPPRAQLSVGMSHPYMHGNIKGNGNYQSARMRCLQKSKSAIIQNLITAAFNACSPGRWKPSLGGKQICSLCLSDLSLN
jgi:hypothetical protein